MEYYVYLTGLTLAYLMLVAAVWVKTRTPAFLVGSFFLYFWSLFGAWRLISALSGGGEMPYLVYKLFPVDLDADYATALFLYFLFIAAVMLSVLYFAGPSRKASLPVLIEISHWKVLTISSACGLLGYWLVRDALETAAEGNLSGYIAARNAPFYTIYQILNHGALSLLAVGLAVFLTRQPARLITGGRRSVSAFLGYLVVFGGLMVLLIKTGNRGETAITFGLLVLFYLANSTRPSRALVVGCGAVGLAAITIVKLVRDNFFASGGTSLSELIARTQSELFASTESVAAHLSMYGALHKHLPLTYGSSIGSLVLSVVPRAIWPDRPGTIYEYYAAGVGAEEGQGYTIHHATAWFLNFGIPGLIAGAVLIGWAWAKLHNLVQDGRFRRSVWKQAFAVIAFWTFTSGLPDVLRAGPEVYKTLLFQDMLIPTLFLVLASSAIVKRNNRPVLKFRRIVPAIEPETL